MEKVSIIVPMYNAEKTIKRCIDSIINQTYKNIEVICINDGSKDRTEEILKEINGKNIILISQKNSGVSVARNNGIKKAQGKYIMFVDSDDYIEKKAVEFMVKTIEEKKVDLVRVGYWLNEDEYIEEKCELKNKIIKSEEIKQEVIPQILNGKLSTFIPLLLIKKDIIKDLYFDEELEFLEDRIMYINLCLNANSVYITNEPIYHYCDNPNSITRDSNRLFKNIKYIKIANEKEKKILGNKYINIYNTRDFLSIINSLYNLYRYKKITSNDIKNIVESRETQNILINTDERLMRSYHKFITFFIRIRKYKIVILIFYIRKNISKLRRRKNGENN